MILLADWDLSNPSMKAFKEQCQQRLSEQLQSSLEPFRIIPHCSVFKDSGPFLRDRRRASPHSDRAARVPILRHPPTCHTPHSTKCVTSGVSALLPTTLPGRGCDSVHFTDTHKNHFLFPTLWIISF